MGLLVGVMALLVIWGTFAFSIGPIDPGGPWVPAPQYWQSLTDVRTRVELSTPAFMLGQISPSGFLGYYPFVFLVKTPLPTLLLLLIGIGSVSDAASARRCGDVAASGLVYVGGHVWRPEPGLSLDAAGAAVCVDDRRAGRERILKPRSRDVTQSMKLKSWRLGIA